MVTTRAQKRLQTGEISEEIVVVESDTKQVEDGGGGSCERDGPTTPADREPVSQDSILKEIDNPQASVGSGIVIQTTDRSHTHLPSNGTPCLSS